MTDYTYIQNMFTWVFNKHAPPKKNDAITKSISDHFQIKVEKYTQ